jgi:hypothetical protein
MYTVHTITHIYVEEENQRGKTSERHKALRGTTILRFLYFGRQIRTTTLQLQQSEARGAKEEKERDTKKKQTSQRQEKL